jgi:hypothetical protein
MQEREIYRRNERVKGTGKRGKGIGKKRNGKGKSENAIEKGQQRRRIHCRTGNKGKAEEGGKENWKRREREGMRGKK